MKRIAIWGHSGGYGGIERMIYNFYKYMDKSKIQYDFLVPHDCGKIAFEDEIIAMGGRVFRILYSEKESFIKARTCWKNYFRENPEVVGVHVNTSFPYAFPLKMAKKSGLDIRVLHSHGSEMYSLPTNIIQRIRFKCVKRSIKKDPTKYVACGEKAARFMFGDIDYTWIKNGIETEKFAYSESERNRIRQEYGFKDDDILIGQIGHLSNTKQPLFTIEVIKEVIKQNKNVKLLLIGSGPLADTIKKIIKDNNLEKNVFQLGVLSDVSKIYQVLDCITLPSLHEGFPVVLVEAQTAGVKCLVSDQVTTQAVQTDLCKMISLNNKEEWIDSIINLQPVNNRKKYEEIMVSKGFDIADAAKEIEKLYR